MEQTSAEGFLFEFPLQRILYQKLPANVQHFSLSNSNHLFLEGLEIFFFFKAKAELPGITDGQICCSLVRPPLQVSVPFPLSPSIRALTCREMVRGTERGHLLAMKIS